MKRSLILLLLLGVILYLFMKVDTTSTPAAQIETLKPIPLSEDKPAPKTSKPTPAQKKINTFVYPASSAPTNQGPNPLPRNQDGYRRPNYPPPKNPNHIVLPYVLEDGVVVVHGDMVVGEPADSEAPQNGLVEVPTMKLWPTNQIPVLVDPNVSNPERIQKGLALFNNSAIQFVPYSGQKDALVFIEGTGVCKSFVGYVGGHQRIWLEPRCSPTDIAHEVMHALGFVHEQNRVDRDEYIHVAFENIEEQYASNFDKLPELFMTATGLAAFDFESIMMYPSWMFSKNGQPTMISRYKEHQIRPTYGISPTDIERVNRAYTPKTTE